MKKTTRGKIIYPPNKRLGQSFLFEKNYLQKIVNCCPIDTTTVIIEIGSGYGSLTNLLANSKCQKVIGLEKDPQLFQWLISNNQKKEKIFFLRQDVLKVNWEEFSQNGSLIVVGNLPYYLTNSLIVDLLFNYHLFKSLVFLVQKEVGQKWASSPHKYSSEYSALSVFINYLAETKINFEVPREVFAPAPSVDGVLVIINPYQDTDITKEKLTSLLRFLKNCFRFRRKTLFNNLLSFAGNWKKGWEEYFSKKKYSTKIRPQNLTPAEYWELFLFWQTIGKNKTSKNVYPN